MTNLLENQTTENLARCRVLEKSLQEKEEQIAALENKLNKYAKTPKLSLCVVEDQLLLRFCDYSDVYIIQNAIQRLINCYDWNKNYEFGARAIRDAGWFLEMLRPDGYTDFEKLTNFKEFPTSNRPN